MLKNTYFILGFFGVGKTSVLRILKEDFGYPTIDSDELIELESGKNVRRVFIDNGISGLRSIESRVLKRLLKVKGYIISVAANSGLSEELLNNIKKNGKIIYLKTDLRNAISRNTKRKPVIFSTIKNEKELVSKIKEEYIARNEILNKYSDITIYTGNKSRFEIAKIIDDYIRNMEKN
ncbi:MAG: shikimate kinase [Thermotogaceae bacterium]|nr:shikimate kinase [Thermotogaceae bacterium]MDN5338414.1 shikimate kinase [Thermotogaceae bacterium]